MVRVVCTSIFLAFLVSQLERIFLDFFVMSVVVDPDFALELGLVSCETLLETLPFFLASCMCFFSSDIFVPVPLFSVLQPGN